MLHRCTKLFAVIAGVAFAVGTYGVPEASAEVNFAGKKIELIVPFREGGGGDTYARLFVPYLERKLPGKPTILIRNFPGGGSIKGNNKFEARGKPDGLTIVTVSTSSMVSQIFGGKKVKYDILKWRPIIVSPHGTVLYALATTGIKGKDIVADLKTLRKQKLKYGAKKATASELRAILSFELLGLDVKSIFGLSRGKARKAMMRGELQINHDTAGTYFKKVAKLVEKGQFVPLYTLGYPKEGGVVRDPAFPNLPHAAEVYEKLNGKKPSGPNWKALQYFMNMGVMASKGFALPKGTPDDIYDTYVAAAKAVVNDKDFRKRAKKLLGAYPQTFGKEAAEVYKNAVKLPPDVDKWLRAYIKTKFDVDT